MPPIVAQRNAVRYVIIPESPLSRRSTSTVTPSLKQALRVAATQEQLSANADFGGLANVLLCYVIGRWQQYAKSGFTREPAALWAQQWPMLYITCLSQRSA